MKWTALLLLLTACSGRSSPAPAPATPAGTPPPISDSTRSVLSPDGADCVWRQVDASTGLDRPLVRVHGSCQKIRLAWSPDGRKASLRVPASLASLRIVYDAYVPELQDDTPREIWEVDLVSGRAESLALPPGDIRQVAFGADSQLCAFTEYPDQPPALVLAADQFLGIPPRYGRIGVAFRYSAGRWKQVEQLSGDDPMHQLALYKTIGPDSDWLEDDAWPKPHP